MLKTILKRVLQCIPTLFIVVTFTFVLTRMIPGNPAATILGPQASAADIAAMEVKLGLDQPKLQQFINYIGDVLHGDFGTSYMYNQPVVDLIAQRIPSTLQITVTALIIALIVGVAIGMYSALHQYSALDYVFMVLALVGVFLITTHGSLTGLAVSPAALVSGIVSACCVAIYTMWPKKLQEQYPTPMLQGWAFLMGGIMFSLIFRPWQIDYVPTAMGAFGIFTVVVLGNVLAFSLYMSGVPLIGPQKASLYSFAEPVTAAIISTLVLGSPFTLWDALGFGCIFLMLVLLSLPAKQKN